MILQSVFKNIIPRNIFLLDSLGALLSGYNLAFVLVRFESFFGMPENILKILAIIAFVFSFYSIICYLLNLQHWQPFLKIIAFANICYCLLTASMVIFHIDQLTLFGVLYFILEIILILILSLNELKVSKKRAIIE